MPPRRVRFVVAGLGIAYFAARTITGTFKLWALLALIALCAGGAALAFRRGGPKEGPISFRTVRRGTSVVDRGGKHVGTVRQVVVGKGGDEFRGISVAVRPWGPARCVPARLVIEITPRAVVIDLTKDELRRVRRARDTKDDARGHKREEWGRTGLELSPRTKKFFGLD